MATSVLVKSLYPSSNNTKYFNSIGSKEDYDDMNMNINNDSSEPNSTPTPTQSKNVNRPNLNNDIKENSKENRNTINNIKTTIKNINNKSKDQIHKSPIKKIKDQNHTSSIKKSKSHSSPSHSPLHSPSHSPSTIHTTSTSNNNNNNSNLNTNINTSPLKSITLTLPKSDSSDTLYIKEDDNSNQVNPEKSPKKGETESLNTIKNGLQPNNYIRNIQWSVATERGYEKGPNHTKKPIHNYMEDFHFPTLDHKDEVVHPHPISGLPVYIWLLADGHGGHEAPQFFIREMNKAMNEVIDLHDWNWDNKEECKLFEKFIKEKYMEVDREFCRYKTEEFKAWKNGNCKDPKPLDDGCTFVVNMIYKNYHINCNVGDSRSVLGRRENIKRNFFSHKESVWSQVFGSRDHSPELSDMAYHIVNNGGIFLNQNGSRRNHGTVVPPSKRGTKPYQDLMGTRIFRPINKEMTDIGISNMRTLNMGATMGDLLFKIAPAVLCNEPDVTFNKLNVNKDYLLVIATDGVWDYLKYEYSTTQTNNNLLEFVGLSMTAWCQNKKNSSDGKKNSNANNNLGSVINSEILSDIAKVVVQRDYVREIYCSDIDKFDDCTAFLVFIPALVNTNAKQQSS